MGKEVLINEISQILAKYADPDGEDTCRYKMNFFRILGLQNKELIHSKFLAFLLNPKGSHGCQHIFLDEFIKILDKKGANINSFACAKVRTEISQKINRKENAGGRIDILIFNKEPNRHIIVENKIYAADQHTQLQHYHNTHKNAILVYLTLDGKKAGRESLGSLEEKDYIRLSYKDDILEWLANCMHIIEMGKPKFLIHEYRILIENMTKEAKKRDELIPILTKDEETVKNVFFIFHSVAKSRKNKDIIHPAEQAIYDSFANFKSEIIKKYFIKLLPELASEVDIDLISKLNEGRGIMKKGWGSNFTKKRGKK
jgi:hypothetical protein